MSHLSVVIPVLNDARMLDSCLRTLAAQQRPADEVLVVDNGSDDESAEVAVRHGARVISEPRPGITAASAAGFDDADGDIIVRCDADSRLPSDWLQRIERRLDENPDAVAVTGPAYFYDLGPVGDLLARTFYLSAYFLSMRGALGNNAVFGSNYAIRATEWRRLSAEVPRDDTELHDDLDLSFRLAATANVIHDRELVVGVSGRPFSNLPSLVRRWNRAVHTIALHWPEQSPQRRWRERLRGRAEQRRLSTGNRPDAATDERNPRLG